jgi:hypothetical protein
MRLAAWRLFWCGLLGPFGAHDSRAAWAATFFLASEGLESFGWWGSADDHTGLLVGV